jgi:cyclopropane-fatty-acyl-phospholipid synthase
MEDITPHYATTLHEWRQRFSANLFGIRALGYSDTFVRMWEFYLCYCEDGFLERAIGDMQLLLTKPGCRREPLLSHLPSRLNPNQSGTTSRRSHTPSYASLRPARQ